MNFFKKKVGNGQKEIKANRFTVVDAGGKAVAAFGAAPDGAPALVMFDGAGVMRACIGLTEKNESCVGLFDSNGKERFAAQTIELEGRECVAIFARDENGKSVISMGVNHEGEAGLVLGTLDLSQVAELQAPKK